MFRSLFVAPVFVTLVIAGSVLAADPTPADHALVTKFEALRQKLDTGRGREVINLTRDNSPDAQGWIGFTKENTGEMALQRLKGDLPATDAQLAASRASYGRVVAMLEKIDRLPESKPYEIVERRKAITIDGRIDPREWKGANVVPLAYVFPRTEPTTDSVATCRLMWDRRNLYAAFDVPDAQIMGNEALDNEKNTFLYDCVELFLVPDPRFPAYWEVNITPKNEILDRLIMKKTRGWFGEPDPSEDIEGIQVATKLSPAPSSPDAAHEKQKPGYTIEIAIPWSQLPNMRHGPRVGDTLLGVMAWSDVNDKLDYGHQKYYSQVPTVAGFNSVWEFQVLKLVGKKGWFD